MTEEQHFLALSALVGFVSPHTLSLYFQVLAGSMSSFSVVLMKKEEAVQEQPQSFS